MKFLTNHELEQLEHGTLRLKYRQLQSVIEASERAIKEGERRLRALTKCKCTLDGVTCSNCQSAEMAGEEFDRQALVKTIEIHAKSAARDKAKVINGLGD